MASSEVEVVSSSSPFGCVLKDHNLRDHRSSAAAASATTASSKCQPNLQKTLKELVRDHLRSSASNSPSPITVSNENCNSIHHSGNAVSRITNHRRGRKLNHVEETPSMSRRQARVLDRWATQQAKGMISTIEKQGNQEKISALSNTIPVSSKSGNGARDPSPVPSDSSSVSSLVQKWRGIETSDPKQSPRSPTSSNQNPNPSSGITAASRIETCDPDSESTSDWDSDRGSPSGCVNAADREKREKSRLADIIRKLPLAANNGQLRHGLPESGETAVVYSPRIRGRQALSDLFSRLVHDRYSEIEVLGDGQPVTNFPKRSRLQTFLKLRLLRHENSAQNDSHSQRRKSFESSKCRLSTVTSLRRRFSTGAAEQDESVEEASISDHSSSSAAAEETDDKDREEIVQSTVNDATSQPNLQMKICNSSLTETLDGKFRQEGEDGLRNTSLTSESVDHHDEENSEMDRSNNHQKEDHAEETPCSNVSWTEPHGDDDHVHSCSTGTTDSLSCNIWEEDEDEEEYNNEDYCEPNLDWIFDIARPRSYWESRRQARYQEIFESSSNDDIRQLIQRKSVSAALASDFRATMDQLMMSSVQLQMHTFGSQEDEDGSMVAFLRRQMQSALSNSEKEQLEHARSQGSVAAVLTSGFRDKMDQLMMSRVQLLGQRQTLTNNAENVPQQIEREQDHMTPAEEQMQMQMQMQKHVEESKTEENEQETPSSQQCNDGSSYYEQSPSSQLPWSSYEDREDVDDLERMESATIRQESFNTTNSYDDSPMGPYIKNSSTYEMELICDLRVQMEHIYREMADLRKTVNRSVDTQSNLRSIIREEVSAAMRDLKGNESKRKPSKGFCCVCNEKKADTLLYRCGHMCSCFECAHELQWGSGKCPICWAQIEDVVRVNTDY